MAEEARDFDVENATAFAEVCKCVQRYMPKHQYAFVKSLMQGEESNYFKQKLFEIATKIKAIPRYGEDRAPPTELIAHLHYFGGGFDAYVCALSDEQDPEEEVLEAFGRARFHRISEDGELGCLSIAEYKDCRYIELDFHWEPTALAKIR